MIWERKNRERRSFSLTELLLVVALLLVLASLLSPSLKRAKEQAEMLQCSENMKAIHMASTIYAHDFNYYYPFQFVGPEGGYKNDIRINSAYKREGTGVGFLLYWYDYIRPNAFWCPADDAIEEFGHTSSQNNKFARRQFYEEVPELGTFYWSKKTWQLSGPVEYKWDVVFRGHLEGLEAKGKLNNAGHIFCDSGRRDGRYNPQVTYFRGMPIEYVYKSNPRRIKHTSLYHANTLTDNSDMIYLTSRSKVVKKGTLPGTPVDSVHGGKENPMLGTLTNDGAIAWDEIPLPMGKPYDERFLLQRTSRMEPARGTILPLTKEERVVVGALREGFEVYD